MKTLRSILVCAVVLSAALTPCQAAFWAVSRAISRADSKLEEAKTAYAERRFAEAKVLYDEALDLYADIRKKHPDAKPEHVLAGLNECRDGMLVIATLATPANLPANLADPVPVGLPETDNLPVNEMAPDVPASAEHPDRSAPGAADGPVAVPRPVSAPTSPVADSSVQPAAVSTAEPVSASNVEAQFRRLVAGGRAGEAVLFMETVIGDNPSEAPLPHRLLHVRALAAAGNYPRAIALLETLREDYPGNPAVLTLFAGVQLAYGNPFAALRLLDEVERNHPRYADLYVDFAYVRFAQDPDRNRGEAIAYYKAALARGAARDPRLEDELRITVDP